MIHLIAYTSDVKPANLGDVMQTVALARLVGCPTVGMRRDHEDPPPAPGDVVLVNGFWYKPKPVYPYVKTLFVGIHVDANEPIEPFGAWFRSSPAPIGARDPATAERIRKAFPDLEVVVCGCSTITLPRWYGPRSIMPMNVDCEGAPGEKFTQMVAYHSWEQMWTATIHRIRTLATSSIVYTSKMHTTLPCVALGTPVMFSRRSPYDPTRLSLLEWLGLREDATLSGVDTQGAQNIFLSHLSDALGWTPDCGIGEPPRPV